MENNVEQNILKRSSRKLIIFEIVCVALIIGLIGYTYSFFNVTATNDSVIYGEAASVNLSLTVEKLAPSTNKGLVPQLDQYITSAVIGRNGSCVDDNNNNVCQVYKITVTNSGASVHVNGTLTLSAKNNPNLKWAIISGTTNPTLVSSVNPYSYVKLTENELYNSNESKDYYIVLWISETGTIQTDQGGFSGVVTVGDTESVELPTVSKSSLAMLGLTENDTVLTTFTNTSKNDGTTGIYKAEDDLGESYYFRGNVTNNYVKFAGYYWRIIRINGDGTIRMIYDGTSAHDNGESSTDRQISTSAFNSSTNDNAYIGYMYGTAGSTTYEVVHANINSSTIKTVLDNWYKTNLISYSSLIADSGFCGDRSLSDGLGYGKNWTKYGAWNRLRDNKEPQFVCPQNNDLYTTTTSTKGNKALTYPIGLITADEVAHAGGVHHLSNNNYYLSNWPYFWTMSPAFILGDQKIAIFANTSNGEMDNIYVNYSRNANVVANPVINIKSTVAITGGDGTKNNPYVIKTN